MKFLKARLWIHPSRPTCIPHVGMDVREQNHVRVSHGPKLGSAVVQLTSTPPHLHRLFRSRWNSLSPLCYNMYCWACSPWCERLVSTLRRWSVSVSSQKTCRNVDEMNLEQGPKPPSVSVLNIRHKWASRCSLVGQYCMMKAWKNGEPVDVNETTRCLCRMTVTSSVALFVQDDIAQADTTWPRI